MNSVILIGRLVRDPEVRYGGEKNTAVAIYSLAVDRRFKREGEPTADFINCIAFGKQGEFVEKYLQKGMKIAVTGHIKTGSYTNKDGYKVYTTEVVADNHEFCESKGTSDGSIQSDAANGSKAGNDGFMDIPADAVDDLPFD